MAFSSLSKVLLALILFLPGLALFSSFVNVVGLFWRFKAGNKPYNHPLLAVG